MSTQISFPVELKAEKIKMVKGMPEKEYQRIYHEKYDKEHKQIRAYKYTPGCRKDYYENNKEHKKEYQRQYRLKKKQERLELSKNNPFVKVLESVNEEVPHKLKID